MGFTEADRKVAEMQRARQNMTPAQASRHNAATMRNAGPKPGKQSTPSTNSMGSQKPMPTMNNSQQQTRPQGHTTTNKQLADPTPIPAKPTPEFRFPGISLEKQREIEARGLKILQDAAKHKEHLCKAPCNCEKKKMDPKKEISGLPDLDYLYNLGGPEFGKMKHARDYEGLSQALMKVMQNPKFIKGVQDQVNGTGAPKGAKAKQLSQLEWQEILGMNQYLNGGKKTHSKTPPTKSKGPRNVPDPSRGQMVQPAKTKAKNPQGGRPQGAPERGPLGQLSTNNVPIGGGPQQAGGLRTQAQGGGPQQAGGPRTQAQGRGPRRA